MIKLSKLSKNLCSINNNILLVRYFSKTQIDSVTYKPDKSKIIDYRNTVYAPTQKLEFDQSGRCLLYFYKPRPYTYILNYSKYLIPFGFFAYIFKINYSIFPAANLIIFGVEAYFIKKVINQKRIIRNIVTEVNLLRDGETIEIVYENQFWRKLKSDEISHYYYIPLLKTPQGGPDFAPLTGELFPEEYPFEDNYPISFAWRKYYRTPRTFFSLPKYSNYVNMEILVAAFSGKIIDTSKINVVEIDIDKREKYKNL